MDVDHDREADQDETISQLDRDDPVGVVGGEAVTAAAGITDWTGNTNNLPLSSSAAALEYVRRSNPPPFLRKTYAMVDDPSTDSVISWNADGTAFVVWHPAEFARDMLPTLFKHSNFSSFVRQLNTYGFRKVATSRWEFYNAMFQRGKKDILGGIRRRKAWSTHCTRQRSHQRRPPPPTVGTAPVSPTSVTAGGRDRLLLLQGVEDELEEEDGRSSNDSTTSSSSPTPDQIIRMDALVDENRRLKQENGALSSKLANMKSKCDELLELVAAATHTCRTKLDVARIVSGGGDCEVTRPKLFGVTLELTKRED